MAPSHPPLDVSVVPTRPEHLGAVAEILYRAHGYTLDAQRRERHTLAAGEGLGRFPQGQLVALARDRGRDRVVGFAGTMRTARPPNDPPLTWREAIGHYGLPYHDPGGAWLYGVEVAVDPAFQRRGVGSALYRARFRLVDRLGLSGWYAGGLLMGYRRHAARLSPRAYAQLVIDGELVDPTVTMQLRRGLVPSAIIEEYYPEPKAGNCAVLLTYLPEGARQPLVGALPLPGVGRSRGLARRYPKGRPDGRPPGGA
jgi:GNAT superfamily N-acetyltransferase